MPKATPRKKAMDALQKLARVSEAQHNGMCRCVSCGSWWDWKDGDGAHFIAKGHSSYWALKRENVHFQCKYCNGFGMKHGVALAEYTLWMINKYSGEYVEEMLATTKKSVKIYKKDYLEMTAKWNEEIKFHLDRIA